MWPVVIWAAAQPSFWAVVLNSPVVVALAGTVIGGVGLKLVEKWLGRTKDQLDIRGKLIHEIEAMQTRLDKVEEEVTHWRNLYYNEQEKAAMLRIQLIQAGQTPADTMTLNLHVDKPEPQ